MKPATVKLTGLERSVALDVLLTIAAYTEQETREQFNWSRRELDAWSRLVAKIDRPETER